MHPRLPESAGFGNCAQCAFVATGPAELCFQCAQQTFEALMPFDQRCKICDLPLDMVTKRCGNPMCNWTTGRHFGWNYAIAIRSGQLERALNAYKYDGRKGWGMIFGRVLEAFLELEQTTFRDFELILASPTFTGSGGRNFDHTRYVLERAALETPPGRLWPFDLDPEPTIIKTAATPRMARLKHKERRGIAEGELRSALKVMHPERVQGRNVLVYDDVFTDGFTLNEVARALREEGDANVVCGVSLCRQPWTRPRSD